MERSGGRVSVVENAVILKLFDSFPNAIINRHLEFIADSNPRVNSYFSLHNCETETDVIAKLLEWLSRDAYKSKHFRVEKRNAQVHQYHLDGINRFCGTNFSREDMKLVYSWLGNGVDHEKTLAFIRSGYDMEMLRDQED